jgi:hypothetical protein
VHGRAILAVRSSGITPAGGLTGATNIAAGDSIQRQLGIVNSGSAAVRAAGVRVTAPSASRLASSLTVRVDRCSAPWVAPAGGQGLSCRGMQTSLTGSFAPGPGQVSLALAGLKPNQTAWLRVTVKVAAAASAAQQGVATTLTYTFFAS